MMILPDESPSKVSDHQSRFARAGAASHRHPDTELVPGSRVSSDHLDHLMTVIMMITAYMWHHHMIIRSYITHSVMCPCVSNLTPCYHGVDK